MHCKFFPSLRGKDTKMSASAANTAVYTTDTPKQIKKKINKHAFSGGRETAEEQRKYGANLEVDISYQWLRFFLFDDAELESIGEKYANGTMLTGEVKARLIRSTGSRKPIRSAGPKSQRSPRSLLLRAPSRVLTLSNIFFFRSIKKNISN